MALCVFIWEVTSCTWATSAHELPLKRLSLQTKRTNGLFYVCHTRMCHFEYEYVLGPVLYTNVLYMLYMSMRVVVVGGAIRVCYWGWISKKMAQYVVCSGTVIHINNLASLPYSLFILFSSLPFDIPLCFHSHTECIMPTKQWKKYTKRLRKQALYSNK